MLTDSASDPVAVLIIDVPDAEESGALSWRDFPEFPKKGYRHARVYLRNRGAPFARLTVDLDDEGFPHGPVPEVPPLAIVTLANGEPGPESRSTLPLVSIVVSSTGSRQPLLRRCIRSLLSLRYPAVEIVLVDNRPQLVTDESDEFWREVLQHEGEEPAKVTIVREVRPGLSFARNAGVLAASGEIVAFTDDDVEVEANWLSGFVDAFNVSTEVQCVTGLVVPAEMETEAQVLFENFYGGFDRGLVPHSWIIRNSHNHILPNRTAFLVAEDGSSEQASYKSIYVVAGTCGVGANMAVRREFALRHPFDVGLGAGSYVNSGEDIRFYADVLWSGQAIAYVPSAIVRHTHRRDMDDLKVQVRRMGTGQTAMLTSMVFQDIRHLVGITLCGAPNALLRWVRSAFSGQSAAEGRDQEHSYPSSLRRTELIGMMLGPWRYLVSRRRVRSLGGASTKRPPAAPRV